MKKSYYFTNIINDKLKFNNSNSCNKKNLKKNTNML